MSTPRDDYEFPSHICEIDDEHVNRCTVCGKYLRGVSAPLEPTAEESFTRWVEENKFTVIPDETPHRQWQLIFADFHAAAVSKNLQEERDQFSKMAHNLRKIAEEKTLLVHELGGKLDKAESRISGLESEITALRETK